MSAPSKHSSLKADENREIEAEPPNKRRRIALACSACRARKSRCDGARPKCSLCRDLGFECTYVQAASSSNVIVGKEYFSSLEDRVQGIEDTLDGFRSSIQELNGRFKRKNGNHKDSASSTTSGGRPDSDHAIEPDTAEGDDQIDEVFALGDGFVAMEKETGFFGPSSNIAFLRHIAKAVGKVKRPRGTGAQANTPTSSLDSSEHLDGGFLEISRPGSPIRQVFPPIRVDIFNLPPEKEILMLVERFFEDTGFMYPFLHKETFLKTFHQNKVRNPKQVPRTWLGLLNIIMTMATATEISLDKDESHSKKRMDVSENFFKRGMLLCERPMMRGASVEVIQFLLYASMYLHGSQKSVEAWTIHGLAVKAAFQLGLHSRDASQKFTGITKELRKRAWYGCILLDRTLSMTFGRPFAIPESYVRIDMPDRFQPEGDSMLSAYPSEPDSTHFFLCTIKLYHFMYQSIEHLFGSNLGCGPPLPLRELTSSMLRIDNELAEWERQLPHNLRLQTSQEVARYMQRPFLGKITQTDERLSFLITLRYHNIRLLLHRPILARYLDLCAIHSEQADPSELNMLQKVGGTSIQVNLHCAGEIITMIHCAAVSTTKRATLGAWWFSLYYTFNAGLVIFATLIVARSSNANAPQISEQQMKQAKESLGKTLEVMAVLDKGNIMVDRCRAYIEPLVNIINTLSPNPILVSASLFPEAMSYVGMPGVSTYSAMSPMEQSHFSMEFGEFMMPSDLDWMSSHFGNNNESMPTDYPQVWPNANHQGGHDPGQAHHGEYGGYAKHSGM